MVLLEDPPFSEHLEPEACSNAHFCILVCRVELLPSSAVLDHCLPAFCVQLLKYSFLCLLPALRSKPLKPNKQTTADFVFGLPSPRAGLGEVWDPGTLSCLFCFYFLLLLVPL